MKSKYKGYLKSGDVAKILGVAKSTVKNWDEKNIFSADLYTESNIRLYKLESVMRFLNEKVKVGGM